MPSLDNKSHGAEGDTTGGDIIVVADQALAARMAGVPLGGAVAGAAAAAGVV